MKFMLNTLKTLLLSFVLLAFVLPQGALIAQPHGGRILSQLNEQQRTELKAMVNQLRSTGASREEIRTAVHDKLKTWNIEPGIGGGGRDGRGGFWGKLTDDQKTELQALIDRMRTEGKSRDEIRTAVHEQLKAWNIDITPGGGRGGRGGHGGFWSKLTDVQKAELQALIDRMRTEGKSREEIHTAVHNQLKTWGIEITPGGGHGGRGGFWTKLTEGQRAELKDMIHRMRVDGKNRTEIHQAVMDKLKLWGVEWTGRGSGTPPVGSTDVNNSVLTDARSYPNPFNPSTTINYSLKQPSQVSIRIFTTDGELVRELFSGQRSEGTYSLTWDGTDDKAKPVASGTYLCRILAGNETQTLRLIMTK